MAINEKDRVLLVEDDQDLAELLFEELEGAGYQVDTASSAEQALVRIKEWPPALVVSDLRLPGDSGMSLLSLAGKSDTAPAFLIITAFGTINQAVEALKAGADEFLTKPLDIDHFLLACERLVDNRHLRSELQHYRSLMAGDGFHGILGQSPPMRSLYQQMRQISAADGPVLVVGESGTGKELVARAVHEESTRAQGPFLAVNCAGIPSELMESEFFGHVTGAFTGARKAREGLLAQADGGVLLLDEIAEMPLTLQAKLLRALQDGSIRPVGANDEIKVDVRIIAATHRDLQQRCTEGSFREDLYFRLETFMLKVPPLREREGDIELLADHFLNQNRQRNQRIIRGFTSEALAALQAYNFPGNVRELQNAVDRAVAFCDASLIDVSHLPQRIVDAPLNLPSTGSSPEAVEITAGWRMPAQADDLPRLEAVQRHYVQHVLEHTGGNKRRAADILGVTRRTLYRWLES
ncbi:MAG: sigma-54 dependent transcriptional regulator [Pseudohongiellaceae bacterium]